jgi:hypothetical protein
MSFDGLFGGLGRITADTLFAMPFLCDVEVKSLVDDGHGGKNEVWTPLAGGPFRCAAAPASGRTHVEGDVPKSKTVFVVTIKGGIEVGGKDRVRVYATDTDPERLVEVKHVLPLTGVLTEVVGLVSI